MAVSARALARARNAHVRAYENTYTEPPTQSDGAVQFYVCMYIYAVQTSIGVQCTTLYTCLCRV